MDQPTTSALASSGAADPDDKAALDDFLGARPPSRRARYLKWGAVALVVLLVLWIAARLLFGSDVAVSYATQPLRRGNLTVSVSATGNLAPTNEVEVGSELSGLVTEVFVDNNDRVRKGQVLARLDTSRFLDTVNQSRAQLASAQAQVQTAEATAQQSRATLARFMEVYRLSGGKVPSGTELDAARADNGRAVAGIATAQAAVAQARAVLSSAETQLAKASILSPVTGVVLSRSIEPGQTVAASLNAPVLFKIAEDLGQMRLEVKVDEADVGTVAKGQRATFQVDAFPGRTFPALIERVDVGANASSSSTSSSSGTTASSSTSGSVVAYTARLTVDNRDLALRPGMTATADIVTAEKTDVLLVPNAALRFSPDRAGKGQGGGGVTSVLAPPRPRRGGGAAAKGATIGRGSRQTVYALGDDGKPQAIQVTVGDTNGSETEVTGSGLAPGMEIITGQLAAGQTNEAARGGARRDDQAGEAGDRAAPRERRSAGTAPAPGEPGGQPIRPAPESAPSQAGGATSGGAGGRGRPPGQGDGD
ncbi:efflux RND transporter periplasmic adaptor subunit [Sphingomonas profundi]|uniref:efflux RND transporter periplasmic adaptor subunit n=1 Tax=Alterirhizorhabdus profundi TaxID=2681549 RepID=UPI0012E90065|nr:efflux RND transporter periplasmic adaptor subunit [Sphingomonas profundi]